MDLDCDCWADQRRYNDDDDADNVHTQFTWNRNPMRHHGGFQKETNNKCFVHELQPPDGKSSCLLHTHTSSDLWLIQQISHSLLKQIFTIQWDGVGDTFIIAHVAHTFCLHPEVHSRRQRNAISMAAKVSVCVCDTCSAGGDASNIPTI